tara:strand:+ start:334407 stop:335450 length:1044 start_codon:yes stop_codon:yes gene_type:complete
MNWQFAYPWILLAGSVIPLIWIVHIIGRSRYRGVNTSVPSRVAAAGISLRTATAWIPNLFLSLALALLVIATARPQEIIGNTKTTQDTIAIELVVDRSGSMDEKVIFGGQKVTRLEAVKVVVEEFIVGDDDQLNGREGDLLGLIVFGSFADTLMPLTQSHKALVQALRRVELPRIERERSTAIGDALMLAAARLKASEDSMRNEMDDPDFELKSKAIVLLTDGENRAGSYSPEQAAALAKDWGIKIYIIGIRGGTSFNGMVFGGGVQEVNDQNMAAVAQYTGGQYWGVDKVSDLTNVYAQIDELERSTIQTSDSTSYEELYLPFALAGLITMMISFLLENIVYREGL